MSDTIPYQLMSVAQLRILARQQGLRPYKLKKAELVALLQGRDSGSEGSSDGGASSTTPAQSPTPPDDPMVVDLTDPMDDLNMLPPPQYATASATKALYKELRSLLKIQETVKQEERGWVLDAANVTNLYQ
ncbi:hypothetical protein HDV00_005343 [Rhizophlyctis rosea]|nr:hypothetical protein HDV00_005343 [Rhizophlyctis rosea]